MRFQDKVNLYPPRTSRYNQIPTADVDAVLTMSGIVEENAGLTNNGYYDQLSGDAHLYLPGNNRDLVALNYQINGWFCERAGKMYRIESVSIGKASLTCNNVQHIECSLTLVNKEVK